MGVLTVVVLMSPMILRASFSAWYMRSISSRRCACSADSSISVFWSPHEYRLASSSEKMNSLVCVTAGEERRGLGPDAYLPAPPAGSCWDRELDWKLWGREGSV